MSLTIPNTLSNGVNADASKVQQNFDEVASYVNTNAILKDASVAFTSVPSGPASDPTTANQLARKSYVDATATAAAAAVALADGGVSTEKLADSSVTSAKIADGTIVNADINASAAITTGKLVGVMVSSTGANRTVTVSSSAASGTPADGDIWIKY